MAKLDLGRAKAGSGATYRVEWDSVGHQVYVYYAGDWKKLGRATSAGEAMAMAEAYLHDK